MALPNYDLSDLEIYKTNIFTEADKDEAGFIIALGVFYNDIKDLLWMYQVLADNEPEHDGPPTKEKGQYYGQTNFITRYLIGVFHEFIILMQDNEKLFSTKEFLAIESLLVGKSLNYWSDLKKLSTKGDSTASLHNALLHVRNRVSFHYNARDSHSGFLEYVSTQKENAQVYVSDGENIMNSRLYFADASPQSKLKKLLSDNKTNEGEVLEYFKKIAPVLKAIITGYIDVRNTAKNGSREQRRGMKEKFGIEY